MPDDVLDIRDLLQKSIGDLVRERPGLFDPRRAFVDGIEITQTIQRYHSDRHLTTSAGRGLDNSVELAAYKRAWIRVYVRQSTPILTASRGSSGAPLTGVLRVERGNPFLPKAATSLVAVLEPTLFRTVIPYADPAYATERGALSRTLNFILPARDCWGHLHLTAELREPDGTVITQSTTTVTITLVQTLRLRGILVSYSGPSTAAPPPPGVTWPTVTLAAPTLADLAATSARALRAMPVQSQGSFASAGTVAWTRPLDDPRTGAGGCSVNWNALLTQLGNVRTNDGNRSDVVYYGLLPGAMPLNVPGCGVGGLGGGATGDQQTLLHEIGHGYGFQHTPCGAAGATDSAYPNYQPYASASIGEYGLDIADGTIFSPQTARDYMSYCFPQWMSLYQHDRLIDHPRLAPTRLRLGFPWRDYVYIDPRPFRLPEPPDPWPWLDNPWTRMQRQRIPVLSVIGTVRSATEVEIASVVRVEAEPEVPGTRTAFRAELLDANRQPLRSVPLHALRTQGCCGCRDDAQPRDGGKETYPFTFQALIPHTDDAYQLRLVHGDRVLWERTADEPPRPPQLKAEPGEAGTIRLAWSAGEAGRRRPDGAVLWAQWALPADTPRWHGLVTGLEEIAPPETAVSRAGVPAGEVLVRLLASDGFHTVPSNVVRVMLPAEPPSIAILAPADGAVFLAGGQLHCWATVLDAGGIPVDDGRVVWLLDGEPVARGSEAHVPMPAPGAHTVTIRVTDVLGRLDERATVTHRFTVEGRGDCC